MVEHQEASFIVNKEAQDRMSKAHMTGANSATIKMMQQALQASPVTSENDSPLKDGFTAEVDPSAFNLPDEQMEESKNESSSLTAKMENLALEGAEEENKSQA